MKVWKVTGWDKRERLDDLFICTRSENPYNDDSYEALKKARLINDQYSGTQLYKEIEY